MSQHRFSSRLHFNQIDPLVAAITTIDASYETPYVKPLVHAPRTTSRSPHVQNCPTLQRGMNAILAMQDAVIVGDTRAKLFESPMSSTHGLCLLIKFA